MGRGPQGLPGRIVDRFGAIPDVEDGTAQAQRGDPVQLCRGRLGVMHWQEGQANDAPGGRGTELLRQPGVIGL
jgi:hypothetical protein